MGVRHSDKAANHNSTHFLVWSTGPLLIFFGRPDGKLFLSFLLILLCFNKTISLLPLVVVDVVVVVDEVVLVVVAEQCWRPKGKK